MNNGEWLMINGGYLELPLALASGFGQANIPGFSRIYCWAEAPQDLLFAIH